MFLFNFFRSKTLGKLFKWCQKSICICTKPESKKVLIYITPYLILQNYPLCHKDSILWESHLFYLSIIALLNAESIVGTQTAKVFHPSYFDIQRFLSLHGFNKRTEILFARYHHPDMQYSGSLPLYSNVHQSSLEKC